MDSLKKSLIKQRYKEKIPTTMNEIEGKLKKSEADIQAGKVHSQEYVEQYFKLKFK